MSSHIYINKS